jgi:hypothetical protein
MIIAAFLFTLGISLIDIQFPPFKTTGNSGNGNNTNDPSSGEIINVDNTTINLDTKNIYAIVSGTLGIVVVLFGQWMLAKTMGRDFEYPMVSNFSLNRDRIIAKAEDSNISSENIPVYASLELNSQNINLNAVSKSASSLISQGEQIAKMSIINSTDIATINLGSAGNELNFPDTIDKLFMYAGLPSYNIYSAIMIDQDDLLIAKSGGSISVQIYTDNNLEYNSNQYPSLDQYHISSNTYEIAELLNLDVGPVDTENILNHESHSPQLSELSPKLYVDQTSTKLIINPNKANIGCGLDIGRNHITVDNTGSIDQKNFCAHETPEGSKITIFHNVICPNKIQIFDFEYSDTLKQIDEEANATSGISLKLSDARRKIMSEVTKIGNPNDLPNY